MGASLLAPATVILMVAGAIHVVVGGNLYWLWLSASIGAGLFFMLICFKCKPDTQITVAGYMSTFYAILMLAVTVGIVVQTSQDSWTSPNAMFIIVLTGIFMIAGVLHPEEMLCLVPGILYFLCIPSGFLLLFIYSMCNMHVVSWGTREIAKVASKEEIEQKMKERENSSMKAVKEFCMGLCCCLKAQCVNLVNRHRNPQPKKEEIVKEIMAELGRIEPGKQDGANPNYATPKQQQNAATPISQGDAAQNYEPQGRNYDSNRSSGRSVFSNSIVDERQRSIVRQLDSIHKDMNSMYDTGAKYAGGDKFKDSESLVYGQPQKDDPYYSCIPNEPRIQRDDLVNPFWITDKELKRGHVRYLDDGETNFWQKLIEKYLHPLAVDKVHETKVKTDLITLRNNAAFLFFMVNFLWLFIIFLLQIVQDQLKDTLYIQVPRPGRENKHFEPLSVAFLVFFALIILIQFVSMLFHRYGTFLHILASTSLRCCSKKYQPIGVEEVVQTVKIMQQIKGMEPDDDPEPDYDILGDDLDEMNPDIVHGTESQRRRKPNHYSNKTLRGAFVKRYNALSKRSQRNKQKTQRKGINEVFDNVAFTDEI